MKRLFLTTLLITTSLFSSTGKELTKTNGCMVCHNIMGKKNAPAFMGTAKKNIKWYGLNAKTIMKESIKNGSQGKYRNFTDTKMPAFDYLTNTDLDIITSWILDEYEKNKNLNSNNSINNMYSKGQGKGQGKRKGQGMMR